MTKVAIIILNWNGKDLLKTFLPSVIQNSKQAEIIIADNGSNDGSIDFISNAFPEIRIIDNKENLGFTGGYNKALKEVEAEYYIILNSDIEVSENWIKPIIDLMDEDKNIGVCQPKIRSYIDKSSFEYAGASGGFIDMLGYPFCRGRIFDSLEKDNSQYNNTRECFWASGAALFIRAELFHKFSGFDQEFFAHQEEIDLCWRLKNAGYKVMVCPESVVYHLGGGTLNKSSAFKTYLNFRNNHYLLYKNYPVKDYNKIIYIRYLLDYLAAFTFLLKGRVGEFKAVFKALEDFKANRVKFQNKRNYSNRKTNSILKRSILLEYHIFNKREFKDLPNL